MGTNDKRIIEIVEYYLENEESSTLTAYNISSETLHRYKRSYKDIAKNFGIKKDVIKILENYSEKEIKKIASGKGVGTQSKKIQLDFSGNKFKFCLFSDTHIGSIFFLEDLYFKMLEECEKQNVDAYFHAGDVTEGMSHRPGHVYELTHIGLAAQRDYAIELLSKITKPLYMISGNHDHWMEKVAGINVVIDIAAHIENAVFVGRHTGNVMVNKCKIQLWHGEDGSSYATSYRMQKVIESITGGSKPNVLLLGHVHKMAYIFERHIHAISGGCVQLQTDFMKMKRLAAHTGFWIVELTMNNKGNVVNCAPSWYPFYM